MKEAMRDAPEDYQKLEMRVLDAMRGDLSGEEFNTLALEIYRFQRTNNRPYDNYCRHLGAAVDLENWQQIPAAPQSAFKEFALRSFPENFTTKTFRTSGTTGEGFGEHHFLSTRLYDESILRGWDYFKLPRLPQIILAATPEQAPYSSLSHMMDVLRQRSTGLQIQSSRLRAGEIPSTACMIMGTALAFLHLFESNEPVVLPSGSCALETGGYKGSGRTIAKPELYGMFGVRLGLAPGAVINEYGMTELSSQFYTRGLGSPHEGPPWARTMVINPGTGKEVLIAETGMLRIFDLANLGSVIAIQTQDLAIRREAGFELLGRDPAALPRGCSRAADEMLTQGNFS